MIWTDSLKTICLVTSVVLCIVCIAGNLGLSFGEMVSRIGDHYTSRAFFFDNPKEGTYFWKQFLAGVFMVVAMTGLDQDMMQRTLACRDYKASMKNMMVSGVLQFFVVGLFLILGTLLVMYVESAGIAIPEKTDELFGLVASDATMPIVVGIMFILGLISAAYSAAGSALTSLTTSFTVDILKAHERQDEEKLTRTRKLVHVGMSVIMGIVILIFYAISNEDAISAVYKIASYTYGPILGLFVFGMFCRINVRDRWVPVVCVAAPVVSYFTQWALLEWCQYTVSHELILINAAYTIVGLLILYVNKSDK